MRNAEVTVSVFDDELTFVNLGDVVASALSLHMSHKLSYCDLTLGKYVTGFVVRSQDFLWSLEAM